MTKPYYERGGQDPLLTTKEVSDRLGVSLRTVQLWVKAGTLPAGRTPGGHRRIRLSDVTALAERNGLRPAQCPPPERPEAGRTHHRGGDAPQRPEGAAGHRPEHRHWRNDPRHRCRERTRGAAVKTARTSVDPKALTRHIRPPYASKVITRVRAQHQIAADNAKLISAGLTPPAAPLHGHGALCRQQRIDAYGQRLEMLMRADFERQAVQISAFLGALVGDMADNGLMGHTRIASTPARLQ